MKVVTVIGARPQFIKAAAVSRQIKQQRSIQEILIHTGQHYDANMSDVFFREMEIPKPDYHLCISGRRHGSMTGEMLAKIEEILIQEKPDWTLVYGDTNTTLAGALSARKLHFRVAHVEAGLRSNNMQMPEEINRILTDRISDLLFCPTPHAVENLAKEGYHNFPCIVENPGDVMQDAAIYYAEKARGQSEIARKLLLEPGGFILCTIHRAANTESSERLAGILRAMDCISREMPVILPLHPRTRRVIESEGMRTSVCLVDPAGYLDMLRLLRDCALVMTDSGGLQKEAYFFKKPCITLREETEWIELVESGCNVLAGSAPERIVGTFRKVNGVAFDFTRELYGGGHAAEKIVASLLANG